MADLPVPQPAQVSPYDCFVGHFYNQVFRPGMAVMEVYKTAQERWKCMTPAERAPYSEIASNQRERLGLEMPSTSGITISTAESSVRKRKRAVKDPNAPKRATTAFFYFAQEERPKVREVNPEFKVTDISKKLGEMWRAMDAQQKQPFQDLAVKDRERYHAEQKIYLEKVEAEKKNANGTQGSAA